jgi:hypothetical protein
MPRAEQVFADVLVDTWGRRNRRLAPKECPACRSVFRPLRSVSRFCSRPCMWSQNGGRNRKDATWWTCPKGYIIGRIWEDGKQREVKQHRHFMEVHLGRRLLANEDVHHVNGVKTDNRLENLQVVDHGQHSRITNAARTYRRGKKLILSAAEITRRSLHMRGIRHAAIARAKGTPA